MDDAPNPIVVIAEASPQRKLELIIPSPENDAGIQDGATRALTRHCLYQTEITRKPWKVWSVKSKPEQPSRRYIEVVLKGVEPGSTEKLCVRATILKPSGNQPPDEPAANNEFGLQKTVEFNEPADPNGERRVRIYGSAGEHRALYFTSDEYFFPPDEKKTKRHAKVQFQLMQQSGDSWREHRDCDPVIARERRSRKRKCPWRSCRQGKENVIQPRPRFQLYARSTECFGHYDSRHDCLRSQARGGSTVIKLCCITLPTGISHTHSCRPYFQPFGMSNHLNEYCEGMATVLGCDRANAVYKFYTQRNPGRVLDELRQKIEEQLKQQVIFEAFKQFVEWHKRVHKRLSNEQHERDHLK